MFKLLNNRKNYKVNLNGLIIFILLIAFGYTVYFGLFQNTQAGHVTADSNGAHDFILSDLEGESYSLSDYSGKGVLVNFWATYCPPCEKELPYIENAYLDYKNQGVEVLAINVEEPMIVVNKFISEKNISFPILLDRHGEVSRNYGVLNLPISFFISADGKIVEQISGEMTEETIRENMEKIKP